MPSLTKRHIQKLYHAVNSIRDHALLTLLLDTGLQLHDISELKLADFSNDDAQLVLSDGSDRVFDLHPDTIVSLNRWLADRPKTRDRHLFVTEKGDHRQLSTRGVDYILRQLGKQADLPFALNVTVIKEMVDGKDLQASSDDRGRLSHKASLVAGVMAAVFVVPLLLRFLIKTFSHRLSD